MKKAFILHGMSGPVDSSFGINLKQDLTALGFQIYEPKFTILQNITLESWFEEMDKIKDSIDDKSIFICHSLGCLFIVKYCCLHKLKNKLIIAVAGGLTNKSEIHPDLAYLSPFIPTAEEIKKFKTLKNTIYNIYSNTDHIYKLTQLERYNQKLNATPIYLPNKGHFGKSSGVKEIPEIIEIIKKEK